MVINDGNGAQSMDDMDMHNLEQIRILKQRQAAMTLRQEQRQINLAVQLSQRDIQNRQN